MQELLLRINELIADEETAKAGASFIVRGKKVEAREVTA